MLFLREDFSFMFIFFYSSYFCFVSFFSDIEFSLVFVSFLWINIVLILPPLQYISKKSLSRFIV
jgi:hypothetical protein